jgi:outer membrane autotransporter protein
VNLDGFAETGAGALNLQSSGQSASYWRLRPSVELAGDLVLSPKTVLRPSLKLGYDQPLDNARTALTTRLEEPYGIGSFATVANGARGLAEVDFGLDIVRKDSWSVRLGYVGQFSHDVSNQGGRLKVVVPF